jgi:cytochrome c-type biogenesis protein CcmH/NrfG
MDLGGTNNPRQRGIEYAWAGDYHNAIQAFNQAIALRPQTPYRT